MTLETLIFLRGTLGNLSLPVGDPNFPEVARLTTNALAELDEAIKEQQPALAAVEDETKAG